MLPLPSAPYIIAVQTDGSFCLATCSHASFLLWLIFDPENGGDTFFRNVGSFMDYTALHGAISHKMAIFEKLF
jgi:hypothetical protein